MKRLSLLFLSVAFFALACVFYVAGTSAQTTPEPKRLFEPLAADRAPVPSRGPAQSAPAAVREQEIQVNFGAIDFAAARELSLPLFDELSYTAVRSESEGFAASADGGFLWRGKIFGPGGWEGDVTLSAEGRALSGLIYSPEGVYEIVPQKNFTHLLVRLDQSRFPACGGTLPQRPASETASPRASDASAPSSKSSVVKWQTAADATTAADDGSLIDVLVVYTSDVRTSLGGTTQAQAFAQQAVNSTNTAYINSAINTRVRLAGTLEASYTETGTLSAALNWVSSDASVAVARNSVKADMVAFIVDGASDSCGLAYLMHTVGPGFAGSAFSAVARSCAVGNLSFAHELGHNEGCEHNPENGDDPGSASFPYAFGHYVDGAFRTVMSYSDPCTNGNCPRIAYFSNPSVNFGGLPTGIANQRDNHRVINNTAPVVAQFRDSSVTPPPNDDFANAQALGSGNTGSVSGTNVGATKEPGEPVHFGSSAGGSSVWYVWTAPSSGRLTLTTAGSNFDTVLAAYNGGSLGTLTQVASHDDVSQSDKTSSVNFKVTSGTAYRIAVDGFDGVSGNVRLNWGFVPMPANNDFVDAAVIGGTLGSISGTNVGATKEPGEVNHAGNAGGASIWYSWTAPSDGALALTTTGSNFNTLLEVYNGSSVTSLSRVANNDDASAIDKTSSVTFNVTSGITYRIAVDGFNGATGNVTLNWNLGTLCTYSITAPNAVFQGAGGANSFSVTAPAGCPWTASAGFNSWITITSARAGAGNGTANYTVAANPNTSSRLGSVTVNGIPGAGLAFFNVFQEGTVNSTVQLGASTYNVNESERKVLIGVTRTGDTSSAASVTYATADGTASRLSDYTQTLGTLSFAPGETTKTVTVFVTDDVLQEAPETFTFTLSNASGASLTLGSPSSAVVTVNSDDATDGLNPVGEAAFNPDFFVRQHYIDFLNREPDAAGLAFWTGQTTNCGNPDTQVCRVNVSAAFFQSIEFQNTGYLVYRFYKAAFGDLPYGAGSVPYVRLDQFMTETQRIGRGVVVNAPGWELQLEANKQAYALEFMQSPLVTMNGLQLMPPAQFVDRLRANTGTALSQSERDALVSELTNNNTNAGRASVLRKVAEDADLQAGERNRAFVLMQYYGYLRRNPFDPPEPTFDYAGYNFWLGKLDAAGGDFVRAEMVKAFLDSIEYRRRFGP